MCLVQWRFYQTFYKIRAFLLLCTKIEHLERYISMTTHDYILSIEFSVHMNGVLCHFEKAYANDY